MRLSRALLVYGTSSYQEFPYRHPIVTLHEVIHDANHTRLSEGQLMTPQMLIDVVAGLGRSVSVQILPGRELVPTAKMIRLVVASLRAHWRRLRKKSVWLFPSTSWHSADHHMDGAPSPMPMRLGCSTTDLDHPNSISKPLSVHSINLVVLVGMEAHLAV